MIPTSFATSLILISVLSSMLLETLTSFATLSLEMETLIVTELRINPKCSSTCVGTVTDLVS